MLTKAQLRQHFRALRDAMTPAEVAGKSALITSHVLALPELVEARTVFVYVSIVNEVRTRELIQTLIEQGKMVTVPLIARRGIMQAHRIDSVDALAAGQYGIPAPRVANHHDEPVDVCIAPGLAFTETGRRLGAGGGYYDRYLARHRARLAVGLAYELQIAAHLPTVRTDQAVDRIITEKRVLGNSNPEPDTRYPEPEP
jgi:5-formyltetrahydrofolate cyclo-ligase